MSETIRKYILSLEEENERLRPVVEAAQEAVHLGVVTEQAWKKLEEAVYVYEAAGKEEAS